MSTEESRPKSRFQKRLKWIIFTGDFPAMKKYLSKKNSIFWNIYTFLDVLLRGFAQMAFANNPISGFLIVLVLLVKASDVLAVCALTGFLGLIVSMLIREPTNCIENGLTIFNPMLVGVVSYELIPYYYGSFDGFSVFLLIISVIYSTYFARAMRSTKIPAFSLPYMICEFVLIIILKGQCNIMESNTSNEMRMDNATRNGTIEGSGHIVDTVVSMDWGMVFRGTVTSASQIFAVDDVAVGSIIYLAVLIYSPITAGFSFIGALVGSLVGIGLGAPYEKLYSGLWGFPCYLTGAAMDGTFMVLNRQTTVTAFAAVSFTALLQHALYIIFDKVKVPPLTLAFYVSTWLFLALGTTPEGIFFYPKDLSYSEKRKYELCSVCRQTAIDQSADANEPEVLIKEERKT